MDANMKWKTIDSAPHTGEMLLLLGTWGPALGSWRADENYPEEDYQWFDNSYDDFSTGYASTPIHATHYIELPPL